MSNINDLTFSGKSQISEEYSFIYDMPTNFNIIGFTDTETFKIVPEDTIINNGFITWVSSNVKNTKGISIFNLSVPEFLQYTYTRISTDTFLGKEKSFYQTQCSNLIDFFTEKVELLYNEISKTISLEIFCSYYNTLVDNEQKLTTQFIYPVVGISFIYNDSLYNLYVYSSGFSLYIGYNNYDTSVYDLIKGKIREIFT